MKQVLLITVLALFVGWLVAARVGKSADARAYAITRMADQRAANMQQARQQRQAQFDLEMAKQQAIAPYNTQTRIILNYVIVVLVSGLGLAVCLSIAYLSWGAARAGVVAAQTRAMFIPMDKGTMHYPLLMVYDNGRRRYVLDANTGLVLPVGEAHSIIKLLAENSGATRQLGIQPRDTIMLNDKEQR